MVRIPLFMKMGQDRNGQGSTLGRVCTGSQLIKKNERVARRHFLRNETMLVIWEEKVLKTLLDTLLITDICINFLKQCKF